MSATSASNCAVADGNERSIDDLDELVALARMIAYAKCSAEDVALAGAMHWLDLALQAVNREIAEMPNNELRDLVPSAAAINSKRH
jgi:hypothetical protein